MGIDEVDRSGIDSLPMTEGWVARAREVLEEHWFSYLLFVPTLIFLILLMWLPLIRGIWMSFHKWTFIEQTWIGLDNYRFMFNWDNFYTSMKATTLFATTTFIQLVIALIAATLVHNMNAFKNFTNGLMLVPYTMAPVVTGLIWVFLLNPDFGPIFQYPVQWGVLKSTFFYAGTGRAALTSITLVTAWTFWPFMFIILLATLDGIPKEHYETAEIFGANRVQRFLHVTLPQLKSAILVVVSLRMIWNLSKVSQPLAMTGGGPGFDTSILAILLYRYVWGRGAFGLAFTVSVVLLTITIAFVILFIREFERESVRARK